MAALGAETMETTGASAPVSDEPKSTSSAMPDLLSPDVPPLKAQVHQRLSAAECQRITLSDLQFRPLRHEDYAEMVALHTEWFPVSYDEGFYKKTVSGELFSMVATHRSQPDARSVVGWGDGGSAGSGGEENLLGIITMSTSCEHHCDDIPTVLGADCATICGTRRSSSGGACSSGTTPEAAEDGAVNGQSGCLAYILTLGVADNFRRRGLASELLRRAVDHITDDMPYVQAIYLHVVTYNEAAIHLYESMKFLRVGHFPSFYYLHGQPYDSFLYAHYLNRGRPPWKWRLRNLLGLGFPSGWRDWVFSNVNVLCAWGAIWSDNSLPDKSLGQHQQLGEGP